MVLGHESAGIIHSVGEKVTSLQPGDRVALEPGETCMGCSDCKCGKYNVSARASERRHEIEQFRSISCAPISSSPLLLPTPSALSLDTTSCESNFLES